MAEDFWYIEEVDLFNIICPLKTNHHITTQKIKPYDKGDLIYQAADPAQRIYLVSQGKVKLFQITQSGEKVVKAVLKAGDIFGELGLLGKRTTLDFAEAMDKDTFICSLNLKDMGDLLKEDAQLQFTINKIIGERILKLERKVEDLVFKDCKTRFSELLLDLYNQEEKKDTPFRIKPKLTQDEYASLIGSSRKRVFEVITDLKTKGLIAYNYGQLDIINPRELAKLAA